MFSPCGQYRYTLSRELPDGTPGRTLMMLMLNPSTADATVNDPTITRCIGLARREGFGRLLVGNMYALRSTDPQGLWRVVNPVGPDNHYHIKSMLLQASRVVCAWGNHCKPQRFRDLIASFDRFPKLSAPPRFHCLGANANGAPKHPLYLRQDVPIIPWDSARWGAS